MVVSDIQDAPKTQNKYIKEFKLGDKKGRKKDINGKVIWIHPGKAIH